MRTVSIKTTFLSQLTQLPSMPAGEEGESQASRPAQADPDDRDSGSGVYGHARRNGAHTGRASLCYRDDGRRQRFPHGRPGQGQDSQGGYARLSAMGVSEITPYLDGPISFVARKLEASSTFQPDSDLHLLPGQWNLKTQADARLITRPGQ